MLLQIEEKENRQQLFDIVRQLDSQSRAILVSVGSCMLAYQQMKKEKEDRR